jgi:ATP-binding cassette subfamily B protein
VLDEPQAFLDNDADRAVLAGLESLKGTVTVVMATNRPSYLRLVDSRFKIENGRIYPVEGAELNTPKQVGSVA